MKKLNYKLCGCEIRVLCRELRGKRKKIAEEHAIESITEALRTMFGFAELENEKP